MAIADELARSTGPTAGLAPRVAQNLAASGCCRRDDHLGGGHPQGDGLPLVVGLYGSLIPLTVYAVLGNSRAASSRACRPVVELPKLWTIAGWERKARAPGERMIYPLKLWWENVSVAMQRPPNERTELS